jgi:hypothetical protein
VSSLAALASSEHQVPDAEVSAMDVFVVVALEILLIPCRVQ